MAYTYTPYSQALPDTTLLERLKGTFTPIRGRENPYLPSLFETEKYKNYYANPYEYTKSKLNFGPTLDDTLKSKLSAEDAGFGGLFMPPSSSGGDSANQEHQRNYYQELEDRLTELNISEDGMDPEDAREAAKKSALSIQYQNNADLAKTLKDLTSFSIPSLFSNILNNIGKTSSDPLAPKSPLISGDIAKQQRDREMAAEMQRQEVARQAEAARLAQIAANSDPYSDLPFVSADYYQTQDRDTFSDYTGAGQTQMDRSLQSASEYYG